MLADFCINSSGDLIIEEKPQSIKKQKISFNLCNTKTQKITLGINEVDKLPDSKIKISFSINESTQDYLISTLKDADAISQLIEVRLKTTLGELPERKDFGSNLSLYKHQNINDKVLDNLKSYLEYILSDYLQDVTVDVTADISYTNGYKQIIAANVFSNNKLLLSYELER